MMLFPTRYQARQRVRPRFRSVEVHCALNTFSLARASAWLVLWLASIVCAWPLQPATSLHHFSWSLPQPNASVGDPFPVAVTARAIAGELVTSFNGSVALQGFSGSTIVITEIDSSDIDRVEFMNVSAAAVDVTGWEISLYDSGRWPAPRTTYVLPPGSVVLPGGLFVLTDSVPFPGMWPVFHTATNLAWDVDPSRVAVLLRNGQGEVVDFVVTGDATPDVIHEPVSILTSDWSGSVLPVAGDNTRSYQRSGSVDHHDSSDWNLGLPTVGSTNADLDFPFVGAALPVALSPISSGSFTNGLWAGEITILQPGAQVYLAADDGQGHVGGSRLFPVRLRDDVTIAVTVQPAPAVVDRNVLVTLIVSNTGPSIATGLILTNRLPDGVSLRGAFSYRGNCGVVGDVVRCELADLGAGERRIVYLFLAPHAVGMMTNSVSLARAESDRYLPNNHLEVVTPISLPALSVGDALVVEGPVGTDVTASFPVTLSAPSPRQVSVQFDVVEGSATSGIDYDHASGIVTFAPGQTNGSINVLVHGDAFGESHETFSVQLSQAQGARLLRSLAQGQIRDDDAPSNDAFANRQQLNGSSAVFSGFTANATSQPGEMLPAGMTNGKSVWWTWTPPFPGSVTMTAHAEFAVKLAVYTNADLPQLGLVAANQPWASRASVTFDAVPGGAYQIAVTSPNDTGGAVELTLQLADHRPFEVSSNLRREAWDTDGTVFAVVVTNDIVYVGGQFDYVSPRRAQLLSLDRFTGAAEPDFPTILGGGINAIVADGAGGWFIGGDFAGVGTADHLHLVHVRSDLSVDTAFQPNPNGAVSALALSGHTLYVAGDFTVIGGVSRRGLAAVDSSSGAVSTWDPEANGRVTQFRVKGQLVYVAGYFSQIGRQARGHLAALSVVTGNATSWNPSIDGAVLALEIQDDRAFIGGSFNSVGGTLRNNLASVDLSTGLATSWNPNAMGGAVTSLQLDCDRVYVGGYFDFVGSDPRHGLAAVDIFSGQPTDWQPFVTSDGPSAQRAILSLALVGDVLYAGGEFDHVFGVSRRDLAAFDTQRGDLLPWAPDPDGGVNTLQVIGGKVFAGFLKSPGGVTRHNLAAFDLITGQVLNWAPDPDNAVYAVALSDTALYIGGAFTNVAGVRRAGLAAIDLITHNLQPWNPEANDVVLALARVGNALYAGGRFTMLGGATRLRVGEFNLTDGSLSVWDPGADGTVHTLAATSGLVYAGGNFNSIGGQIRPFLAALQRSTALATAWRPAMNNLVAAIAVGATDIFVGGRFTAAGGLAANRVASLDPVTGVVRADRFHADGEVRALRLSDDTLYLGGYFTRINGMSRLSCAAVNATTGLLADWNPGLSSQGQVECLELGQQTLLMGGHKLRLASGAGEYSLAMLPRAGAPVIQDLETYHSVSIGASLQVSSALTGQEPFTLQWHFQGAPITGATNSSLGFTNVSPLQTGIYTLVASNPLGVGAADTTVSVTMPVELLSQPEGHSVPPGANVTLSVQAVGSPPPVYQWRLNGANIPGAVYPVLLLTNIQVTDAGRYDVVAANRSSATVSAPAFLDVTTTPLAFADDFASRGTNSSSSGVGSGSNVNASQEAGETNAVAALGGNSVWYSWRAPADGIATFYTRGSSFDTLLFVYTGLFLADLTLVAGDDDSGGFLTSLVSFNAVAGVNYAIAVDGFAAETGRFIFGWQLDDTAEEVPRIVQQPLSQSVGLNGDATLTVTALATGPLEYQWFNGCRVLLNATNPVLQLVDVSSDDLGDYRVRVSTALGRSVTSLPAAVEIGSVAQVFTVDKVQNLLFGTLSAPLANFTGEGGGFSSVSVGFISVSVGSIVSQTFNNVGGQTQPDEPEHCAVLGGASKWLGLTPTADGVMMVDTIGSGIDTFLAVYRATNLLHLASGLIACDDNGAPDGVRSLARFPVVAGTPYLVVVDGVHGERGLVELNWGLGLSPQVDATILAPVIRQGTELRLSAGVMSAIPPASFQWRLNDVDLQHATNHLFVIARAQTEHGGVYSVVVSNFAGVVVQNKAVVAIDVPLQLFGLRKGNGNDWHFSIGGNAGQRYRLHTSENLVDWYGITTNQLSSPPIFFVDPDRLPAARRFYQIQLDN